MWPRYTGNGARIKNDLTLSPKQIHFRNAKWRSHVTTEKELYSLNFPSRKPKPSILPEIIKNALNIQPKKIPKARDYVLVYDTEEAIRNIQINKLVFDQINLDPGGVIVTARCNDCDFVSRFFTPQSSIMEDPVTGSAHCSLIPYWSEQLGKKEMTAMQLSDREGKLFCVESGERVLISGTAKTYSIGSFWID